LSTKIKRQQTREKGGIIKKIRTVMSPTVRSSSFSIFSNHKIIPTIADNKENIIR
jgi:hypothetical protein